MVKFRILAIGLAICAAGAVHAADKASFANTKVYNCVVYGLTQSKTRDLGNQSTYLIRAADAKSAVGLADVVFRSDNATSGQQLFHNKFTDKGLYDIDCQ
jgi:hypothetical protein